MAWNSCMINRPFFSIIIPTYNRASLITRTIRSVLIQTFKDFEIIVVDDGSTDNTEEVIVGIMDLRLSYYKKKNEERGAARNFGISKSRGEYIVFLDSDDSFNDEHLKVLYEKISITRNLNFYATKFLTQNESNTFKSDNDLEEGLYDVNIILEGNPFACNICLKRNNPNLVLFPEEIKFAIVEDWIFLVENLINDKIYVIDNATVIMHDHAGRSMRSDNSVIINKKLLALDWLCNKYNFTLNQLKILKGYAYYFCSIHSYLDNNRKQALNFLKLSYSEIGINKKLGILFLKIILGKKNIDMLMDSIRK